MRQQRRRRRVQIHTHSVHTVFDNGVQRTRQGFLVDVMLILTNADSLWLDLDQFRQGVLKAARDGNSATNRDIQIRELLCRKLRGRIN